MPYNYIKHAERIENDLRVLGHVDHVKNIEAARLGGSTSGEILMGIRSHAEKIIQGTIDLPQSLRKDIHILIDLINQSGV